MALETSGMPALFGADGRSALGRSSEASPPGDLRESDILGVLWVSGCPGLTEIDSAATGRADQTGHREVSRSHGDGCHRSNLTEMNPRCSLLIRYM